MRSRGFWFGVAMAVAAALSSPAPASADQQSGARASASEEIAVGTRLEALDTVTLARAEIAKGSKVNITKLLHRQGRVASVDVELADGQIARVAIATVRSFFRVLDE